jgi:hypothetical protein
VKRLLPVVYRVWSFELIVIRTKPKSIFKYPNGLTAAGVDFHYSDLKSSDNREVFYHKFAYLLLGQLDSTENLDNVFKFYGTATPGVEVRRLRFCHQKLVSMKFIADILETGGRYSKRIRVGPCVYNEIFINEIEAADRDIARVAIDVNCDVA